LVQDALVQAQADLEGMGQRLQRLRLDQRLDQQQERLKQLQHRLTYAVQGELRRATDRCQALCAHLMTLDPDTVVRRGYALVKDEAGQLVTQANALTPGQRLQVQLAQGAVTVQVIVPTDTGEDVPKSVDSG
jgi:exodeoxyribonuclease VII large subunit